MLFLIDIYLMLSTSETDFYNSRINTDVMEYPNHWDTSRDIKDIINKNNTIKGLSTMML